MKISLSFGQTAVFISSVCRRLPNRRHRQEFEREVASNSNGSQLRPEHTAPTRSTKRSSSHRPTVGPRF